MRIGTSLLALLFSAGIAAANPVADAIVQQLQDQGYAAVDVRKTLLGRVRIVAASETRVREIVLNPNSGEILRDFSSKRNLLMDPLLQQIDQANSDDSDDS